MLRSLFALLISSTALAHQTSVTDRGVKMRLGSSTNQIKVLNYPSALSQSETDTIISDSLAAWSNAGSGLNLARTNENSHYSISFSNDFSRFGSAVIGVTEINYDDQGIIKKAAIRINNNLYLSSQKDAHRSGGVYLGDVLTHEVGHLIGLNHTEALNASMFFESFAGQSKLSKDDVAGVKTLYGSHFGQISGTVMGGNAIPVMGAQVKAISKISGHAISGISNEEGEFKISGLDKNDTYYLWVTPTMKKSDLPPYYANTQVNFCPSSYRGGFFTGCGVEESGNAQSIRLTDTHPHVNVGTVSISCSLRSLPDYANFKLDTEGEPAIVWDAAKDVGSERTHVGYFFAQDDWSEWDRLKLDLSYFNSLPGNKRLQVKLISYALGVPLEYEMAIHKNGTNYSFINGALDYVTQTFKPDLVLDYSLGSTSDQNIVEIHVRSKKIPDVCNPLSGQICREWTFPAHEQFINEDQLPYLLSFSVYDGNNLYLDTELGLSDNSSCLDAPFTYRVERNIIPKSENEEGTAQNQMSCGSVDFPQDGPPSSGPMSLILGFLLSMMFILKKNKNFLS